MTVTVETVPLARPARRETPRPAGIPIPDRQAPYQHAPVARVRRGTVAPRRTATVRSRVVAVAPTCGGVAPQPVAASSAVQLTRRGWTVLLGLAAAVAVVLVALAALSHPASGDTRSAVGVAASDVVVQPGDTLWSIAERVAPGQDPRAVVHDLQQTNHLADPTVVEGQVLHVG